MPGSDAIPSVWAGRTQELADFHDVVVARRRAGIYERGRLVVGEAGIGKSVLVNRLADELARAHAWVLPAVRMATGDDAVVRLLAGAQALVERIAVGAAVAARLQHLFDRVSEITLPVVRGGVTLRDPAGHVTHEDLSATLVELARAARAQDTVLLVRVDEVQNLEGRRLSALLTALGDALNATVEARDVAGVGHEVHLPVVVYLSGLPEFYGRAAAAGATFARRFRPLELGPLEEGDLRLALQPFLTEGWPVTGDDGPAAVRMEPGAVDVLVAASHGSPFLFQLVGEAAWNAGTGDTITTDEARRGVAASRREMTAHFRLRLAGLTDLQRRYLIAAARLDDDERTSGHVAEALGTTSAAVGSTAQALDERHRIIRRQSGRITFRSPGLSEYLRTQDE